MDVWETRIRRMHSLRHFIHFLALGLFWGMSPALYKHFADLGMPISHVLAATGFGVGAIMWTMMWWHRGSPYIPWRLHRYGAVCAFLMNMPFALNLYFAGHVPPTELAVIITTSPFFNYLVALATGWETTNSRKLMAIVFGFASTAVLILSRDGMLAGRISWWLLASLSIPMLYCVYNTFAAKAYPNGADTLQLGTVESVWSGLLVLPFLLLLALPGAQGQPPLSSYLILGVAILMWVVERMTYFTLIRDKGAVYTVQATYVATPAAVILAIVFFGGGNDVRLWISLALLMLALYLNNTGGKLTPAAATPQSS
jgi:drug/metabolite transporter (DMT)-like permease